MMKSKTDHKTACGVLVNADTFALLVVCLSPSHANFQNFLKNS